MDKFWETIITVASGIIGVAMVAVIVSRNANTAGVVQASGSAFGNSLAVAESPVTGQPVRINTAYPTSGTTGFSPTLYGGFGM